MVPTRIRPPGQSDREDWLATEEPLEIRVNGVPLAVTLRTPGDDRELAAGYLLTEGIVKNRMAIVEIAPVLDGPTMEHGNVIDAKLGNGVELPARNVTRPSMVTSACGVCGKTTLDAVRLQARDLGDGPSFSRQTLLSFPDRLRKQQPVFARTAGLHAAALFKPDGELVCAREDIGRHNAVDKVIGNRFLLDEIPLDSHILFVSGRTGFEIAQKAWMAGIGIVASISAPSNLAVELAREAGMTLIGFVRDDSFNVYVGSSRVRDLDRRAGADAD
jgi:FdhD protein